MKTDQQKYRAELKEWYKNIKAEKRCIICGGDKKKQFHHVNPDEKVKSVAQMVHLGCPKEEILTEMDKCVILCASCHCKEHNRMKNEKKKKFN